MKKKYFLCALPLMLVALSITGYDIEITSDVTLYSRLENVPFKDMNTAGYLHKEEKVGVLGCFDNKNNLYFVVETKEGMFTYLYDFKFKAIKTWYPTQAKLRFFFHEPLASLQCLIMIPEFSSS
jgi:hypothetical protein